MRGALRCIALSLVLAGTFAGGCAQGTQPLADDVPDHPIDAALPPNDGRLPIDARIDAPQSNIDAPQSNIDAPQSNIDAPSTGGFDCPDTIDYYLEAIDALSGSNPVFCGSGADCANTECCYQAIVCVPA